jgi:hypothetical protein
MEGIAREELRLPLPSLPNYFLRQNRLDFLPRQRESTPKNFYDPVGSAPRSAQVSLYAKGLRSDDEPIAKPNLKIRAKGA